MKVLADIIKDVAFTSIVGNPNQSIVGLTIDSRQAGPQILFAALRGTQVDGHDFIEKAIALGASVILCESLPESTNPDVTYLVASDSAAALGKLSANFYDNPSQKLRLYMLIILNFSLSSVLPI